MTKEADISETDMKRALFNVKDAYQDSILERPLGDNFSLPETLAEVARHYLNRALHEANGNKTKAAELINLPNYQTFDNWLKRYQSK